MLEIDDSALVSELPNYDLIVPALLEGGVEKLPELCKLTPGKSLPLVLAGRPLTLAEQVSL